MTLTKADLAKQLITDLGLSVKDARDLVENFFDAISEALEQGQDVKLSGLGNFTLRSKSARPGRNPRTGEEVLISERTVVTFKQGTKLKELLMQDDV